MSSIRFLPSIKTAAVAVTAVAFACSGLAACGSSGSSGSSSGPITLRMTIWSSAPAQLALFNSIAKSYEKTHPQVKSITFDSIPQTSYTSTLTTQIAGGDAPDLAWILETDAPDFVSSGALTPLTSTLKSTPGYDYSDIEPSTTALWRKNGQLYAYPLSTSPFVMFANDSILTQAGLPTSEQLVQEGKWNWADLLQIASQVHAKTGKAGIIIRDFDYDMWPYLATLWDGWGAEPWSANGQTCEFDSPKMVQAFTYMHDAIYQDNAMPGPGVNDDFFADQSAFTITQISRETLLPTNGFKWNVLPLPAGPDGKYAVVGQAGLGVLAKSHHVAAAESFLAYFTDPANSRKLEEYFPPPRKSELTAAAMSAANPLLSKQQLQDTVIDSMNGQVRPSHVNSAEIQQKAKQALDAMWSPSANVSSVLKGVCTAIDPLLRS